MSHPEGEGTQSGAEGVQGGAGDSTGNGTESNSSQGGTETQTTTSNPDLDRARQEAESFRERMRAADQRAAKFEQELRQLRDKDLPEQEKLKRDFEETQKQVIELQSKNKELALKAAFLEDNTYSWRNPATALRLADLSQVEIQPDGSVSGLKDALKALATSDPYLVNTEAEPPKNEPGGTAPGNNGGSSTGKPDTKGIARRLPAMNTRVRRS